MQSSGGIRLAVQQDPAVPVVDWPVFHSWSPADGPFQGRVFLLDEEGGALAETHWQLPTDLAADEALEQLGWVRSEPWHLDDRGRRVADVLPIVPGCPIPADPSPGADPGSAAGAGLDADLDPGPSGQLSGQLDPH